MLCDNLERWDGMGGERASQGGENICMAMTDPCCCMAETNVFICACRSGSL